MAAVRLGARPDHEDATGLRERRAADQGAPSAAGLVTPGADFIPFNRPFLVGTEIAYIESAIQMAAGRGR